MASTSPAGVIPDKQFFKIGEVSRITGVKARVLRYWESEFPSLRPQKTKSNQRIYRKRDVELLLQIKQLLYKEGFTIAGARKKLRSASAEGKAEAAEQERSLAAASVKALRKLRGNLQELVDFVEGWEVKEE